jgi:hypothetical protein
MPNWILVSLGTQTATPYTFEDFSLRGANLGQLLLTAAGFSTALLHTMAHSLSSAVHRIGRLDRMPVYD